VKLIATANEIRLAEAAVFATRAPLRGPASSLPSFSERFITLDAKFTEDKFRSLVTEELKERLAEIDQKLRKIGVERDPFDAAAPQKGIAEGANDRPQKARIEIIKAGA